MSEQGDKSMQQFKMFLATLAHKHFTGEQFRKVLADAHRHAGGGEILEVHQSLVDSIVSECFRDIQFALADERLRYELEQLREDKTGLEKQVKQLEEAVWAMRGMAQHAKALQGLAGEFLAAQATLKELPE